MLTVSHTLILFVNVWQQLSALSRFTYRHSFVAPDSPSSGKKGDKGQKDTGYEELSKKKKKISRKKTGKRLQVLVLHFGVRLRSINSALAIVQEISPQQECCWRVWIERHERDIGRQTRR